MAHSLPLGYPIALLTTLHPPSAPAPPAPGPPHPALCTRALPSIKCSEPRSLLHLFLIPRVVFPQHPRQPRSCCPPSPDAQGSDESWWWAKVLCGLCTALITTGAKAGFAEVMHFNLILFYSVFPKVGGFINRSGFLLICCFYKWEIWVS